MNDRVQEEQMHELRLYQGSVIGVLRGRQEGGDSIKQRLHALVLVGTACSRHRIGTWCTASFLIIAKHKPMSTHGILNS